MVGLSDHGISERHHADDDAELGRSAALSMGPLHPLGQARGPRRLFRFEQTLAVWVRLPALIHSAIASRLRVVAPPKLLSYLARVLPVDIWPSDGFVIDHAVSCGSCVNYAKFGDGLWLHRIATACDFLFVPLTDNNLHAARHAENTCRAAH